MATTTEEPRVGRARANALGWGDDPGGVPRRKGRIAAGLTLIVVCGWLAAAAFLSAGSRSEVLAVARPVNRFEPLAREDLRVVRVATDRDVGTVPVDRLEDLLGRPASTALVEGALLHEEQLLDANTRVVKPDEAVVGAVLAAEDSPATLAAGAEVEVVVRAQAGSAAGPQTLRGWVLAVEDVDTPGTESQRVTLVVPAGDVALVSSSASEGRVSVAVLGEH